MDILDMIKKILITIVLIVCLLFIQSYVFSESCTITPNNPNNSFLKTVTLGCVEEGDVVNCYFTMFNNSDVFPGFDQGITDCKSQHVTNGSYNYEDYRACIEEVIESQTTPELTEIKLENNLSFTYSGCSSYPNRKTNLEIRSDLSYEMKNTTTNLSLSGIDNLFVKGKNIDIYVNNNNNLGTATFNFDIDNLYIEGDSNLSLRTNSRVSNDCGDIIYTQFSPNLKKPVYNGSPPLNNNLSLKLNDLIVNDSSNLNLIVKTEKIRTSCLIGRSGGDVLLDVNNISNKGVLNINLTSADSGEVIIPSNCSEKNGGYSENAGDVNLSINSISNFKDLNINIKSGNGGDGAKGSDAPATGAGSCSLSTKPGWGGYGGNGGNISFKVKYIENFDVLDINLISGNGGKGADTGFDGGGNSNQADYAEGGNGGSGGNIYLDEFSLSVYNYNNGKINFYSLAGNGYDGGNKINRLEKGKAGDGGNGGTIDHIFFEIVENNDLFNLDFTPGNKGLKGTTPGGVNGSNGGPINLDINYLINKSEDFSIVLNNNYENVNISSTILIDKLHTASYLPKKLSVYTEGDTLLQNKYIKINSACYIKAPSSNIEYSAKDIYINSANKEVFENKIITPVGITPTYYPNDNCSVCDYFDFEGEDSFQSNTGKKFKNTYSLFSNHDGTIQAESLKIYYAKNNYSMTELESYNPFLKENRPLYTNKDAITGILNEKTGLYEYKITPENLSWYFDLQKDLTDKEIYCYYQNYRISGNIKVGSVDKPFNFPFTPIFDIK